MHAAAIHRRRRRKAFGTDYSVNGFNPELVADMSKDYYRSGGATTTSDDLFTHTRNGNATMVDSDGLLKWGPHNLLTYSEQFDNAAWVKLNNATVSANAATAPDGTLTADEITYDGTVDGRVEQSAASSNACRLSVWLRTDSGTVSVYIGTRASGGETVTVTDAWTLFEIDEEDSAFPRIACASAKTIYAWGAHLYRSDLGGMVNNPDRGDSYVPTTSAARYLPRVNHHVYNGSAWVNKGLLVESEARTNSAGESNGWAGAGFQLGASTTATANYGISPDGTQNSTRVQFSGGVVANNRVEDIITGTFASLTHTVSFWMRSTDGSSQVARLKCTHGGVSDYFSSDQTVTGEWQRFSFTQAFGVGGSSVVAGVVNGSSGESADIEVYGLQVELDASTPSSYIPTSGATVTRAAETLTVPAANLPWPSPVVIGEELVTNGTFDTDSDWTLGTGWTISGGELVATSATGVASQVVSLTGGKVYRITADNTANIQIRIVGGSGQSLGYFSGADVDKIFVFTAGAGSLLEVVANGTTTGTIDNISVKEINPLSVSIQMQGEMTYAEVTDGNNVVPFRWHIDNNNRIIDRLSVVSGSDTGQFIFQQTNSGTNDEVGSGANTYSPDINVPFNIASRHGSTFINGAVDGTALTADTTPVALPDLSATDLQLAHDYMGTVSLFRIWADDLGDAGIAEASSLSLTPSLNLTFDGQSTSFTDTGMVV